jgi:hypothetical protein
MRGNNRHCQAVKSGRSCDVIPADASESKRQQLRMPDAARHAMAVDAGRPGAPTQHVPHQYRQSNDNMNRSRLRIIGECHSYLKDARALSASLLALRRVSARPIWDQSPPTAA